MAQKTFATIFFLTLLPLNTSVKGMKDILMVL